MKFHPLIKNTLAAILGAGIALQPMAAQAAIHPMSTVRSESATLQTVDLAVNVDFDYDATPVATSNGLTLDRAYITSVLGFMAQTMFTMTEGRHRVGNVYVYRDSRFGNNVDVKLIGLVAGRSNAHIAGWGKRGSTSNNYASRVGSDPRTNLAYGQVVAHEMGHYLYALYDEYREQGRAFNPNRPLSPAETDTPLDTLMNNQTRFSGFSTPGDYTAESTTAQSRAYGASAWEVLARPPSQDPEARQRIGRTQFSAFSGFAPANAAALTSPVAGWDTAFKVVFVPDPVVVEQFVIARTVTEDQLTAIKNAATQVLERMTPSAQTFVGINTSPGDVLVAMAPLDTEAARKAAIDAVAAITVDPGELNLAPAADRALDSIDALYTANTIARGAAVALNVFTIANSRYLTSSFERMRATHTAFNANVFTGTPSQPGSSAKRALALEDLAKSAMRSKASGGTMTAAQIAHASGGHYNDAHRASALTEGATKAVASAKGSAEATLATDYVESLASGASFALKTSVLAKTDGKLSFNLYWEKDSDNASLRYELTAPDGTRFTPSNALAKQTFGVNGEISYSFDATSNSAHFEVAKSYAGRNGDWVSTVVSNAAVSTGVEQSSVADTNLRAEIEVLQDGTPNPSITFELASDRAVIGAAVTALFYDADGKLKLSKALVDDGTNGDLYAEDGTYSMALGGLLPPGQYDVVIKAEQGADGAVFTSAGATVQGTDLPPEPLGGKFSRTADTLLTVTPTTVVEYFVPSLKKYFITAREGEKTLLSQFPGTYSLTGMSFVAQIGATPPAGTQPICRYYFSPPLANTHFYGPPQDCALVGSAFAGNASVKNEGIDFAVAIPDAAGNCPVSLPVKVYRSFNNRSAQNDGNHRYTVSTARYDQMAAAGYSRDGVVFCAASATDATQ